jgi:D-inositol-3-phosphate glycosyltransferase
VAAEEGVSERVRFLPPRPHVELPWVYSAADVLVMPSRSESFGLAALEAQACGVPVVASGVGGLRSTIRDGGSGYLVEGRDAGSYAARMLAILASPELARRLSRGALANAARFPWEATVDRLLGIYGELLPDLVSARAS